MKKIVLELQSFTKNEKFFVLYSMLLGFCVALEYAITRPSSHAIFLTTFSSSLLPILWLSVVPVNLLAVYVYNRFLPILGPLKMWSFICFGIITINSLVVFCLPTMPWYIFIQCIWKDIYILLMFKQLWSLIHSTIMPGRAKYLYGMIFSMGTIGSCLGSFVPSLFAVSIGSKSLFLFTLPIYLVLLLVYRQIFSQGLVQEGIVKGELEKEPASKGGISLIWKNQLLMVILLLVIAMQFSSGFMEYRFNVYLEKEILELDLRTSFCGKLFGLTNMCSLFFQMVGSFMMIQTIGLRKIHVFIPFVLLLSMLYSWLVPSFIAVSFSYVFLKAIDFSLFSISREMLYVPFSINEKFRAKAIIDVFAYRSSKAFVSLGILLLQTFVGIYLLDITAYLSICIFIGWMILSFFMLRPKDRSLTIT